MKLLFYKSLILALALLQTTQAQSNNFSVVGPDATVADTSKFPSYVSIQESVGTSSTLSTHVCGGVVVGSRYVLTAAHCAGEFANYVVTSTGARFKIKVQTKSEEYKDSYSFIGSDTAVFELDKNVDVPAARLGSVDSNKPVTLIGRGFRGTPFTYIEDKHGSVYAWSWDDMVQQYAHLGVSPKQLVSTALLSDGAASVDASSLLKDLFAAARDVNPNVVQTFDSIWQVLTSSGMPAWRVLRLVVNSAYRPTDVPYQVDLRVTGASSCGLAFGTFIDTSKFVCTGDLATPDLQNGSCYGDSGGPLLQRTSDGSYVVVGIVSQGEHKTCGVGLDAYAKTDVIEPLLNQAMGPERYAGRVFTWAEATYGLKPLRATISTVQYQGDEYQTRCYQDGICIGLSRTKIKTVNTANGLVTEISLSPIEALEKAQKAGY